MERPAPTVPAERLASAGYERSADRTETFAELPGVRALGRTLVFERERGFFFASRVGFESGLPPGGASLVAPTVLSAAGRAFRAELRERGARRIDARGTERLRVETGERARMRRYAAEMDGKEVTAVLCCWPRERDVRLAGGATSRSALDETLALVRAVE